MSKWLVDLWNDVKGNVKYAVLYWLLLGGGFSSMLTVVYSLWKSLAHLPVSTLDLFIAPIFPLTVTGVCGLLLAIRERKPTLNVELIPHGDNDTSAYLEVRNLSQTTSVLVEAKLRITEISTGVLYKTVPFSGKWRGEPPYTGLIEGSVRIEPHESRLLSIASIVKTSKAGIVQQEMVLVGIDGESIKWFFNSEVLPFYAIQITLIGKGCPKTVNAIYRVGPKTPYGPFQMTEVAA